MTETTTAPARPTASTITDDMLDELYARIRAHEQQSFLRGCLVPGCLQQFDVMASMAGEAPARPEWDGTGWRTLGCGSVIPAGGHICPAHVDLVTAHLPHRATAEGLHLVAARCACGNWESPELRWHGAVRGLWEEHLLAVEGARPEAERDEHVAGDPDYCPACRLLPAAAVPQPLCPGPTKEQP